MTASSTYFIDTSYWAALINPRDGMHTRAWAWEAHLRQVRWRGVTTSSVLWELLNLMSTTRYRAAAVQVYRQCSGGRGVEVVEISSSMSDDSVSFYESRSDKQWSVTDCSSFLIMQQRQIRNALTSDHHFEQAGFGAALLNDPAP